MADRMSGFVQSGQGILQQKAMREEAERQYEQQKKAQRSSNIFNGISAFLSFAGMIISAVTYNPAGVAGGFAGMAKSLSNISNKSPQKQDVGTGRRIDTNLFNRDNNTSPNRSIFSDKGGPLA